MVVVAKKFVLRRAFDGEPKATDVALVEEILKSVKEGEIMVEAEYISVDPYMRPFSVHQAVGSTLVAIQVAKVIETKHPKYPIGKRVVAYLGWRTHSVFNPDVSLGYGMIKHKTYDLPDFGDLPASLALGVLGLPGNAAYFGFLEICKPQPGETLVVSSAAGAIGSHVGQISKIRGLKTIGIVDSAAKARWIVDELGFDAAINYKTEDVAEALRKAAPDGVDCYFDNVGGEISSAVINQMRVHGRISVCGSVSCYNSGDVLRHSAMPKAAILQPALVAQQLRMEGFFITRWTSVWFEGIERNLAWIREGKLRYRETVTEGFENMFGAFVGLLRGENFGKAVVKV